MAKKDKNKQPESEPPVDLAARIGSRGEPPPPPPPGPPPDPSPLRHDGPLPPRRIEEPRRSEERAKPSLIGGDEPYVPPPPSLAGADRVADDAKSAAIPSPRGAPGPGETDLIVTPLPTPDDWHRFELALRRVRGVGQLRTEYYRHGVLKVRVSYNGAERLASALRGGVPGYRVRVIGEDRSTLQILVASETEERRPG